MHVCVLAPRAYIYMRSRACTSLARLNQYTGAPSRSVSSERAQSGYCSRVLKTRRINGGVRMGLCLQYDKVKHAQATSTTCSLARVRARAHRIPTWIRSSSSSGCVARLTSVRMCAARPGLKPDPAALLCADDDGDAGPVRAAADRAAAERVLRAVRPRPPQPPPPPPPHAHIHVHTPQDSPS